MRKFVIVLVLLVAVWPVAAQTTVTDAYGNEVVIEDASRIITVGGAVTEIVYDLGLGDRIVAVDTSSIYPPEAEDLPQIGYLRFLSSEPILALDPTLIIATEDAGPPEAVDQLERSGVTFLMVPAEDTLDGAVEKIRTIAAALDVVESGEALVESMQADIDTALALQAQVETVPRVAFIFAGSAVALSAAGQDTGADEMIRLAGAENAITGYEGHMPINAEAMVAAAPDIILTTSLSVERVGGIENFLELPGVAQTPAAENGLIIDTLDELYLIGFTPRLGQAILDLTYLLHPDIPRPLPVALRLDGRFDMLLEAVAIANLGPRLSGEDEFTVFAPTSAAFDGIETGTLESLFSSPISVQFVLSAHVAMGRVTLDDVRAQDGGTLNTLFGGFNVTVEGDTVVLNDTIQMIDTIEAANGLIHVIDGVYIPERSG